MSVYEEEREYMDALADTGRWVGTVVIALVVLALIVLAGSITGSGT